MPRAAGPSRHASRPRRTGGTIGSEGVADDVDRTHAPPDASTRFRAPTYVRNVIERRRLLATLRAGAGRQLVVIHAPAGYGKTTLAVQWLQELQHDGADVAWLGLHRDDNDPHWFLSHLLEALRRALPAEDALDELKALIEQSAEDTQRYTLSALLELVARHERRIVLTFDDWHLIDDAQVHRALVHLLDFAPPNLSLILTSRTRPRLPLSRLAVRRQLTEVDADTLRFDLAETRAFLVDLNGLPLDGDDVARLSEGTDGWVAALQLVSLSLRDSADPARLIRGFSGRHHSVGEYLAENVLSAQPPEILEFLLATSVCDRLCGDLAGRLADRADGQAMLEELERRDLFLRPLDDEREWFRYHHLFAEYLRRRLERDHPDRVPRLHRRASNWFSEHELVSEAVTHALAAGTVERATDLVERHAMALVEHSRMVSLLGLTARLPADAVDARPRLLMAVAWANCLLQRAGRRPARARPPAAGDAGGRRARGDALARPTSCRPASTSTATASTAPRRSSGRAWPGTGPTGRGSSRWRPTSRRSATSTRCATATRWSASGGHGRSTTARSARSPASTGAASRASRRSPSSTWPRPRNTFSGAVVLGRESAGRRSHAAQLAGALLGELHYERGELDEAERLLEESRELGAESGVVDFMIATYAVLARIKAHRGADAGELLAEGAKVGRAARPHRGCRPPSSPNGSGSSWPRGRCARPGEWRRTCPTARPAPAGSAW